MPSLLSGWIWWVRQQMTKVHNNLFFLLPLSGVIGFICHRLWITFWSPGRSKQISRHAAFRRAFVALYSHLQSTTSHQNARRCNAVHKQKWALENNVLTLISKVPNICLLVISGAAGHDFCVFMQSSLWCTDISTVQPVFVCYIRPGIQPGSATHPVKDTLTTWWEAGQQPSKVRPVFQQWL